MLSTSLHPLNIVDLNILTRHVGVPSCTHNSAYVTYQIRTKIVSQHVSQRKLPFREGLAAASRYFHLPGGRERKFAFSSMVQIGHVLARALHLKP